MTNRRRNPWTEFAELLEGLSSEGSLEKKATVEAPEQFADSFEDEVDQTMYRGTLGLGLGQIGKFDEAERIIRASSYVQERADYWLKLAEQQFKAGAREGALDSLHQSEEDINSLRTDYVAERAHVLAHKAKLLDSFGLSDEALAVWNRAICVARDGQETNPNSSDCSGVLANIVSFLIELGRLDLARSVADSITPRFPSRRQHAHTLIDKASSRR